MYSTSGLQLLLRTFVLLELLFCASDSSRGDTRLKSSNSNNNNNVCPCDIAGSLNGDSCEGGPCFCKANVKGFRCDQCKKGFYNLDSNNPDGCTKCWCAGLTSVCKSSNWSVEVVEKMQDWKISNLQGSEVVNPVKETNRFVIADDEVLHSSTYYWLAPSDYLGDKIYSYGGDLRFVLGYTVLRGDTSGYFTEEPDVVLEGGPNNVQIGYQWKKHTKDEMGKTTISVPFLERDWYKLDKNGAGRKEPVSRQEFAVITQNLKRLLIRAKFHTDQAEGVLYNVELEKGSSTNGSPRKMKGMEQCVCPDGYTGPSCLDCAPGYRKLDNILFGGKCVKCECNNHAESCDSFTGECKQPCLHNTEGIDCGKCKNGFYGNARIGRPDDCKPCACPLEIKSNNFASDCSAKDVSGEDYVCKCPPEYRGDKCADCAPGYYGNPMIPGGKCLKCDCGPYNHTAGIGLCHPVTGQCICKGNTGGFKCRECLKYHWGNPLTQDCKPCNCDPDGSLDLQCDPFTGQCPCKPHFTGKYCTECSIQYGICREGICKDGYFGDPLGGIPCQPCDCSTHGSFSPTCDKRTGQCPCKPSIGGRDCRVCPPRHVPTDHGCTDCEDGCVNLLLDDIDSLQIIVQEANITNITNLPYTRLVHLTTRLTEIHSYLDVYKILIQRGHQILYNITFNFDLETLADILYLRARDLESKSPQVTSTAIAVGSESEELLRFIHDLYDNLNKLIASLREYGLGAGPGHGNGHHADRILEEAEQILIELRRRNLTIRLEEVERELRKAKALLNRVRQLLTSPGHYRGLIEKLNRLSAVLSDIVLLVQERVQKPVQRTLTLVANSRVSLEFVLVLINNSTNLARAANLSLVEARRLIEIARGEIIEAAVKFGLIPHIVEDLNNLTETVERQRSILARLNPEYSEKYVIPCKRHVQDLLTQSAHLDGLFFATKEMSRYALQAAQVYQKIVDALLAAEDSARRAFIAAERAYKEAFPGTDDSLTKRAAKAKAISYQLLEEARRLRDKKVPQLAKDLAERKLLLDTIAEDLVNSERNLELINRALNGLPKGLSKTLKEADISLRNILESLADVHQNIDGIDYRIKSELLPKLDRLKAGSASGLENTTKIIEKARTDIRLSAKLATNAEALGAKNVQLRKQLDVDMTDLKNRIMLARQKASSIRVSLSAGETGSCIRSFTPDISPSSTSEIVLHYATKDEAANALILFISSSTTEDFMAIEMVNRKIVFLWNAGSGTQVLEHGLTIETNDQRLLKDRQWYVIRVNRIGNVATLDVQRAPDAHKPDTNQVMGSSPPGFGKMDVDRTANFFIGGLPEDFKAPRELRSRTFSGCLYEVSIDGKRVGLWNFKTNQGCGGCTEGNYEQKDPSTFSFKGQNSYAILPQIDRYDRRKFLIALVFKTFDEDALLFLSVNSETRDYVSITLKEGRIVYQVNIGSEAQIQLVSTQKYNTGQWVRLAAERDREEGVLSVDEELLESQMDNRGPNTMDLTSTKLYFGGVPPNFTTTAWPGITFKTFFGCMKDLQIDTTPLDLLNGDSYGVDRGCAERAPKMVSFYGNGFLELKGQPLREEADFSFTFRTNQTDALLLLSTFQGQTNGAGLKGGRGKDSHYYSVAVVGGLLEARFNGGQGDLTLISEIRVNDGNYHMVTLSKRHRRISMTIDDINSGASRIQRGTKDIDAPENGGLYIGGLPEGMTLRGMAQTKVPLRGIIRDFVFNGKLVKISEPVRFRGVGIGREIGDETSVNSDPNQNEIVDGLNEP